MTLNTYDRFLYWLRCKRARFAVWPQSDWPMGRKSCLTGWAYKSLAIVTGVAALLILGHPLLLFYRGFYIEPFWWLHLYPWVAPMALAGFWIAIRDNWPCTTRDVHPLARLLLFCFSLVIFIPISIIMASGLLFGIYYGLSGSPLGLVFAVIVGLALWAATGENWPGTGKRLPTVIKWPLQIAVALIVLSYAVSIVIMEYFSPTGAIKSAINDILLAPEVLATNVVWSVGLAIVSVKLWRTAGNG